MLRPEHGRPDGLRDPLNATAPTPAVNRLPQIIVAVELRPGIATKSAAGLLRGESRRPPIGIDGSPCQDLQVAQEVGQKF